MNRIILSVLGFLLSTNIYSQKVGISLFNDLNLNTVLITPTEGSYKLITAKGEIKLLTDQIIYLSKIGDSILVRDANSNLGTWARVSIVGQTEEDVIRVKPILPSFPARKYNDNLSFYVEFNRLMTINMIDREKYIACVVEAEAGPNREEEFYKAQSLIARTFAMGHLEKHKGEGFNLCDGTHCQAYKGIIGFDRSIYEATLATEGEVIVDTSKQFITAAFHSNCGGFTANSQDVWLTSKPYLVSVEDKYCTSSRNASWEVTITLRNWKIFLQSKGVDTTLIADVKQYSYKPKFRPAYYPILNQKIPMTQFRSYFGLRSAYFSVQVHKNEVRLNGRGYGHGVGLCQEGAMQMAMRGWKYDKIIYYYYKGVRIVNIAEVALSTPIIDGDFDKKDTVKVDAVKIIQ
ncbi:MAG: SpoIID/LytB domain-containing protein [Bacteroidales bacterium]|nr:MAG: SpoIID/LytB domain-containing protein [Bacteroidales bacterium]